MATIFRMGLFSGFAVCLMACSSADVSTDISSVSAQDDRKRVHTIFQDLDDRSLSVEEQLSNYSDEAVILVPNEAEIRGMEALRLHLSEFGQGVDLTTRHEIVEQRSLSDMVIVQGRVVGTAQPEGDPNIYPFETKNIILFEREGTEELKIWKVIYNAAPTPQ